MEPDFMPIISSQPRSNGLVPGARRQKLAMREMDIAHQRLMNQGIICARFKSPREVVEHLAAIQAQDYYGAIWALGLRLPKTTDDKIERAFNSGDILRTHLLRPTWHFVGPTDIRWLLKLTAPRVHSVNAYMYRKLGLDDSVVKRSRAVLLKELRGGRQLTRDELRDVFERSGIATSGELRMGYLMMHAELDGIVCSGPRRGNQFTYALLEERVPPAPTPARDEALAELARRYFTSRSPATTQDFAKWSGLTVTDAKKGLESVKHSLRSEVHNQKNYWFRDVASDAETKSPTALLLSIYDEYISGYKDRTDIASARFAARLIAQGNALTHVVVVNSQIVGTWRRTFSKHEVVVETELFRHLTRTERAAVASAADRYGKFFGLTVTLRWQ